MDLKGVFQERLTADLKGFPCTAKEIKLAEVGEQGWRLPDGDLPLPVATVKETVLTSNSRWMRKFTKQFGARLAPHGKTTMAPQLFQRQLDDGAWAITVANLHQLRLCRRWRVPRVLMANQIAGRENLRWLMRELSDDPEFDFYLLVDSSENANQLADAAREARLKRPIQALLELGFPGGRTGCRSVHTALEVARTIAKRAPWIVLRGVEGYEALLKTQPEPETRIRDFLHTLNRLTEKCVWEKLFAEGPVLLSAGGSDFYDLVLKELKGPEGSREALRVIRSGCYLTHDSLNYREAFERVRRRTPEAGLISPGLQPALQVWGAVQSLPEPGLAIVNVGKRDVSHDIQLPVPELLHRPGLDPRPMALDSAFQIIELNDQHAYVRIPADAAIRIGDMMALGISHPCTTFDKWRLLYMVNDDFRVTGGIRTFLA